MNDLEQWRTARYGIIVDGEFVAIDNADDPRNVESPGARWIGSEHDYQLAQAVAKSTPSKAAAVAAVEPKDWRVGLFWSSSDPTQQVRVLADGIAQIAEYEKHHSFVKWIDDVPTPPVAAVPVAWRAPNLSGNGDVWAYRDADDRFEDQHGKPVGEPLYTHPAPIASAEEEVPGWKLVPIEPTKEMIEQACADHGYPGGDRSTYAKGYRSMLSVIPPNASDPAESMTTVELGVIEDLLALTSAVFQALDNSEEREGDDGREHAIDANWFDPVSEALDKLEALPDDQPGYTMDAPAKAEWALRNLLATHPAAAQLSRAEVLEHAAMVCDDIADDKSDSGYVLVAQDCAAQIRALKDKP